MPDAPHPSMSGLTTAAAGHHTVVVLALLLAGCGAEDTGLPTPEPLPTEAAAPPTPAIQRPFHIGSNDISTDAVLSRHVRDGALVDADLSPTASIDPTKIAGTAWTAASDGQGSGLDADVLDGVESGEFARYDVQSGRRLLFTSSGRVGLGVPAPSSPLHLAGTASIGSSGNQDGALLRLDGTNGETLALDSNQVTSATNLYLDAYDGQLLLRTGEPAATRMSISSTATTLSGSDLTIDNGEAATVRASGHNLSFRGQENSYAHRHYNFYPAAGTPSSTYATVNVFSGTTGLAYERKVRLHADGDSFFTGGRVGIGTDAPSSKLHVTGAPASQPVLFVENTGDNGNTWGTRALHARAVGSGWNSMAVFAEQTNANPHPTGGTFGLLGRVWRQQGTTGHSSAAVFGDAFGPDTTGDGRPEPFDSLANGVQGETWSTNNAAAGGRFYAPQSTGRADGVYGQTSSATAGAYGVFSAGPSGTTGSKSAIVNTPSAGPVELYAMESAELWFEDIGEGRLQQGRARITLDRLWTETVTIDADHPMQVFVQPYADVELYVRRLPEEGAFEVVERGGGTSDAEFGWRVLAKRKHYEDRRLRPVPVVIDRFMEPDLTESQRRELNDRLGLDWRAMEPAAPRLADHRPEPAPTDTPVDPGQEAATSRSALSAPGGLPAAAPAGARPGILRIVEVRREAPCVDDEVADVDPWPSGQAKSTWVLRNEGATAVSTEGWALAVYAPGASRYEVLPLDARIVGPGESWPVTSEALLDDTGVEVDAGMAGDEVVTLLLRGSPVDVFDVGHTDGTGFVARKVAGSAPWWEMDNEPPPCATQSP